MKKYTCNNCNEEWEFFPQDYKYRKNTYPTTCSLCNMPRRQAFSDIKKIEGIWEAIKFVVRNRIWR